MKKPNWLNLDWLKKKPMPKEQTAPLQPKPRRPYVQASKATAKQPRRYQDRSNNGPQWECIMCRYQNEGVICTHCYYVPENSAIPVPMGGITLLQKVREWL